MTGISMDLFNAAKSHYEKCGQDCTRCEFQSHQPCAILEIVAVGRGQGIGVKIRTYPEDRP